MDRYLTSMIIDSKIAKQDFCYVTTIGRVTGNVHTIEIWFAAHENTSTIYILAGGGHTSDWVRNAKAHPDVPVRIGERLFDGRARVVDDPAEDTHARRLLLEKYAPHYSGDLNGWGRTALSVAIDLT